MARRTLPLAASLSGIVVALALTVSQGPVAAFGSLQSPEQFIGFRVGEDRQLVRWDRIVEYMKLAAEGSARVRYRELGETTQGQPFVLVEISAPETIRNLDRFRRLQRKLYFQGGAPTPGELEEIFGQGKAVVLITLSVHGNEIGATQMALELVHRLATSDEPDVTKVLDNVIVLLVPSANPDGQVLVTDWYNETVGTPFEGSDLPFLYHPYVGHDSNRDMYMLTQRESQYLARLAWQDWFPVVWLDEHQMGSTGPRMFVMPAADPINPNVHPVIYRWNAILGQSQAAALEVAGKDGIIYNSTYTNFWQGALAWSGWWHNQIGLLTEAASARIASPVEQLRVAADGSFIPPPMGRGGLPTAGGTPLPPPSDIRQRTEYPRPWLGGRWTLRDIIDYELIATTSLLETVADRRETILRQIYEVNRQTVAGPTRAGEVTAILIPTAGQHDPREAGHLAERLMMAGVEIHRTTGPMTVDRKVFPAGTLVIPMTQVFARYAKDLLEQQNYPEVRTVPNAPIEAPYDVTAWSLGMLLGVDVTFVREPLPTVGMTRIESRPLQPGRITGTGTKYTFAYQGADTAVAINRLLNAGARVAMEAGSQISVTSVSPDQMEALSRLFGLSVTASEEPAGRPPVQGSREIRAPRIALYSPWTSGNSDEGWTRWILEQYEFSSITTIYNADMRRGYLRSRFDVLVLPDQAAREIVDGHLSNSIRPEYRGGIGDAGLDSVFRFVAEGGTLVTLGDASQLAIERLPVPVRNLKSTLRREQHFAPGSIVRLEIDTAHPLAAAMPATTHGFYTDGPLFAVMEDFEGNRATIVARYPANDVLASGWLRGEDLMAGRAALVSVETNPGRVILFGFRPQHRAQTHATFPLLFNSLYLSTVGNGAVSTNQ